MLARAGGNSGTALGLSGVPLGAGRFAPPRPKLRLSRAVEDMLERSLGAGRVRAETAVDMDFGADRARRRKAYDPDGRVERSTQNNTDTTKTTEPGRHRQRPEQSAERRCRQPPPPAARNSGPRRRPTTKSARLCARSFRTSRRSGASALAVLVDQMPGARLPMVSVDLAGSFGGRCSGAHRRPGPQCHRLQRKARRQSRSRQHAVRPGGNCRANQEHEPVRHSRSTESRYPASGPDCFVRCSSLMLALLLVLRPMVMRLTTAAPAIARRQAPALALALTQAETASAAAAALGVRRSAMAAAAGERRPCWKTRA